MKKNNVFLWGAFSSFFTLLFLIIVLLLLSLCFTNESYSIQSAFTDQWYLWMIASTLTFVQNILFGIVEIRNPGKEQKVYVGYLTIFASSFVFPIFVSLEFYNRSGLTKKEQIIRTRKWVINNFDLFYIKIKKYIKIDFDKLDKQLTSLNKIKTLKISPTREINEYKLDLLEKLLPQNKWIVLVDPQQVLES